MQSLSRLPSIIPSALPDDLIPSYEKLHQRVTTRVLAMKILKQRELGNTLIGREKTFSTIGSPTLSLSEKSRQPSRFLSGASVPNSILKAEAFAASASNEIKDKKVLRELRDASVREIVKRMETRIMELYPAPIENDIPLDSLNVSCIIPKLKSSRMKSSQIRTIEPQVVVPKPDPIKEQQRISRRTQHLAPLSCQRKPTYESIKRAIENSRTCPEIIDIDSIEAKRRRKLEVQDSFEARITALVNMQQQHSKTKQATPRKESDNKLGKKGSRMSRKSTSSSVTSKKVKRGKKRKSIMKRTSHDENKPIKTVSIIENTKEDTETQTYINMKDFMLKIRAETISNDNN
ncbi:hypothetical protein Trydic_g13058 [Trypoxylus dichotomus]